MSRWPCTFWLRKIHLHLFGSPISMFYPITTQQYYIFHPRTLMSSKVSNISDRTMTLNFKKSQYHWYSHSIFRISCLWGCIATVQICGKTIRILLWKISNNYVAWLFHLWRLQVYIYFRGVNFILTYIFTNSFPC